MRLRVYITVHTGALESDGGGRSQNGTIYRRYAIVDEAMHREAATKLDVWAVEQQAKAEAARKGQVKRFRKRQTA